MLDAPTKHSLFVAVLGEAIQGLGEVPSGHLYARVMCYMSLEDYNHVIATLKARKVVTEQSHLLRWIGPKP